MSSSDTTAKDDESYDSSDEENEDFMQNVDIVALGDADRVIKLKPLQKAYRGVKTKSQQPGEIRELEWDMEDYLQNLSCFLYCFLRYEKKNSENCSYPSLASRLGKLFWFYVSLIFAPYH